MEYIELVKQASKRLELSEEELKTFISEFVQLFEDHLRTMKDDLDNQIFNSVSHKCDQLIEVSTMIGFNSLINHILELKKYSDRKDQTNSSRMLLNLDILFTKGIESF